MNRAGRVVEISAAARQERIAAEDGRRHGARILRMKPSGWRAALRSEPSLRSYGTLKYLLEAAREKFERQPRVAHQITSVVLEFVDEAEGPSSIHTIGLRGLARKEHANACQSKGDLREALKYAELAIEIYDALPVKFEQAKARLVACHILREMGETTKALQMVRESAIVFVDYEHAEYRTLARITEGIVLFAQKQFVPALEIFLAVVEQAELEGDKVTLARGLNNAAECARELGDLKAARDFYPRALRYFEELGLHTETTRVRWGYALSLAAEGLIHHAVSELYMVQGVYLGLGMNSHAASASMDIVRIRFEAYQDVRDLCTELVRTFTSAGMTQNAIEALAYLREQEKQGRLTTKKINRARRYFGELTTQPRLLFVPSSDAEEED